MLHDILQQDIQYLPGVGPQRKRLLNNELGIFRNEDLLLYFPYKYVDRTHLYPIRELTPDMAFVQVKGRILSFETFQMGPRKQRLVAHFSDGHGVMDLVWFQGAKWIREHYHTGIEYIVFGKPTVFQGRINVSHPEIEQAGNFQSGNLKLQPHYITTEKMKN